MLSRGQMLVNLALEDKNKSSLSSSALSDNTALSAEMSSPNDEGQCSGLFNTSMNGDTFNILDIPIMIMDDNVNIDDLLRDDTSGQNKNGMITSNMTADNLSLTGSLNKPVGKRIVNYSSSSESEMHEPNETNVSNAKCIQHPKRKFNRFDSDLTYFAEISDCSISSFDDEDEVLTNTASLSGKVGDAGLRKGKTINKRLFKKTERNLGKGRSIRPNKCKSNTCQNNCYKFTEQQRHDIFDYYWSLANYQRQRDWLLSCIRETGIKRKRTTEECSRRKTTYKYVIQWQNTEQNVCQQFLLNTLDISQMTLRWTINNSVNFNCSKVDQRGKHEPSNKTPTELRMRVHTFIKNLPAVPSHYCRNNSSRLYLPADLRNVAFLFRLYQQDRNNKPTVSLKVFRDIFRNDFNIGFHTPKKDKCIICESRKDSDFKVTAREEEAYNYHLALKSASKNLFEKDQSKAKQDNTYLCASFDLQKVLNTPHGNNMLLYYSRKYSFYNETIYESHSREGVCYLWGEADGNRGCNEVCSIIFNYLRTVDNRENVTDVALYCDSCPGQNKNRIMLCMLYTFLETSRNIKRIKIVYLLPGHTYMPVDSVHATIERFIKGRIIWAPSEWATLIANARINPKPFNVIELNHTDFSCWKKTAEHLWPNRVNKTLEGRKILFSELRVATLQQGETNIKIKFAYEDSQEWTVPILKNRKCRTSRNSSALIECDALLYPNPLPINTLKYKDLITLCEKKIIPERYINEYKNLAHKTTIPDRLSETDDEDEVPVDV